MKREQDEWTILGRFLRELTYFTKSERRGIMVLLSITMVTWTVPTVLPYFLPEKNTQLMEYAALADEHYARTESDDYFYNENESVETGFKEKTYNKKSDPKPREHISPPVLFPFNPNTLSKDSLQMLGLSEKVVNILEKYRNKGGRFYKKEDLKKIYGLEASEFNRLEPFISLPAPEKKENLWEQKPTSTIQIDINNASEEEWQQLKGIGPYYSKKIVEYRARLGGFVNIAQVGEVYSLPDSVFNKIAPFLKLETPLRSFLTLDSSGMVAIKSHPYISRRQSKGLEEFILNHGAISGPEALLATGLFNKEEWERLIPYLQ